LFDSVLNVGGVLTRNGIALAPMAGVADLPFIQLAWKLRAGYLVSEMVSSLDHLWDTKKNRLRRVLLKGVYPNVIQIARSDPIELSDTAKRVVHEGADIVNINFRCPTNNVSIKFGGSALLDDITRISAIDEAVV
jgi:tRNA-dihydrouridine synthase